LAFNQALRVTRPAGRQLSANTLGGRSRVILEALGNIGDFIGGIAVVATLLYLAAQIRQNTKSLQTASRQEISSGYRESNRLRLDPETGLAWAKGLTSFSELSFPDRHLK